MSRPRFDHFEIDDLVNRIARLEAAIGTSSIAAGAAQKSHGALSGLDWGSAGHSGTLVNTTVDGGASGMTLVERVDTLANRGNAVDHKNEDFTEDRSATSQGPRFWRSVQTGSSTWDWLDTGGYDGTW